VCCGVQISCFQCDLLLLFVSNFGSRCAIIMENYINSEMTDMVLCYGSADRVALRAQALYCIAKSFRRVVFPIRKHFWLFSTGKWYFSIAFVSKSFVSDSNVRRST
jgi:hypothetical protein